MPAASTILMIRPAAFGYNQETAANNFFQVRENTDPQVLQKLVLSEFDNMVTILIEHGVHVLVIDDTPDPAKPSAIFPNNWLTTSPEGIVNVFPLFAPNRRAEKRDDILKMLSDKFHIRDFYDWSEFETEGKFLEGTGSMVIDYDDKVIYSCFSPRTNLAVLEKFADANGFRAIVFLATDQAGQPVYHTNVMMTIGENFAVLCEEAIDEEWELIAVRQILETTGHEIISITREQMLHFAGNMLEVKSQQGEKLLVMSRSAFEILTEDQKARLSVHCMLLPIPVPSIEKAEGGSVRCMMTEIFLEEK